MLSSVLRSSRAIKVNIEIMRTFTRLRHILATSSTIAQKINELEQRLSTHDEAIRSLFTAFKKLMQKDKPNRKPIGFRSKNP